MSNLLISEPPLQVLPSLAVAIGLNEAIFIQQLHYWLQRATTEALGCKWVYNTNGQWKEQFPFWSDNTIRRTIESLREKKLISTVKLNANKHDQTLFYTIAYANLPNAFTQNGQIEVPNMSNSDLPKMGNSSLSETTTETTTDRMPKGIIKQKNYCFNGETIKLTESDYKKLIGLYPNIDLKKELNQLDIELINEKKWWSTMNAKLNYRNNNTNKPEQPKRRLPDLTGL